jgi:hypothetical protein
MCPDKTLYAIGAASQIPLRRSQAIKTPVQTRVRTSVASTSANTPIMLRSDRFPKSCPFCGCCFSVKTQRSRRQREAAQYCDRQGVEISAGHSISAGPCDETRAANSMRSGICISVGTQRIADSTIPGERARGDKGSVAGNDLSTCKTGAPRRAGADSAIRNCLCDMVLM